MAGDKFQSLLSRIKSADFKVGIVGLGYVGVPLALSFARSRIPVTGIDISRARVAELSASSIPFKHLDTPENRCLLDGAYFNATTAFEAVKEVDVIIVCVPTPITAHLEPDLSFIINACQSIIPSMAPDSLLVLESTTYPGTTNDVIVPLVESHGFLIGSTAHIGYSPEREDPANARFSTKTIPKVVSGVTPACLECTEAVYSHIVDKVVPVSSPKVAELTKLLENIHRSVNIGLMNELKPLCVEMGVDVFEVIEAAATKPFGFTPYYPGPGLGGHCIPIDPFYLSWKAKEYGIRTRFIELAGEINADMPGYVLERISSVLNRESKSVNGSSITLLGLAYKKNIEDVRSSPAITIFEKLFSLGANVCYVDPYVSEISLSGAGVHCSLPLTPELLQASDITVLLTDHDCFDYSAIYQFSRHIVDTRGRFSVDDRVFRA